MAAAGLGSRRDCEEVILAGRVEVDRKVVTELGTRVDPQKQEIRVDGEALRRPKRLYFAVNKPAGVVTTSHDPSGRPRVIDLVPTEERIFAVGRLDRASEGLILVTNDGEFANRLTHPRYGVEKTYLVRVAGSPDQKQLERLKKGVHLAEGFARVDSVTLKKQHGHSTDMTIVLSEGRNREIRRILARVGHKVLALKRIAVGNVKIADLPTGGCRKLTHEEVQGLLALAKDKRRKSKAATSGRRIRESEVRGQGTGDTERETESRYVQKEALLSQPLSLDDLLRDDLDEGPLTPQDFSAQARPASAGDSFQGAVIDDRSDFTSPRERPRPTRGVKPHIKARPGGQRRQRKGDKREDQSQPRESFGKKRGGKRVLGAPLEERRTSGAKKGKTRFGQKGKNPRPKIEGADNQRRGERRGGKKGQRPHASKRFGKPGGKRKGRR
jgi:23S rRNA pseudouridine2605 synthase